MSTYDTSKFSKGLENLHIKITDEQMNKFMTYYENLIEWNKVMNLTTVTAFDDVIHRHFLDSLSIVNAIPENEIRNMRSVIDVGTGAGFPGIPLAIVFPELQVTLMDSLQKRINFLNDTCEKCHVKNVQTVHSRAEDLGHDRDYRERYDLVVSRAVARLSILTEYCLPFAKVNGVFAAYKSGNIDEELKNSSKAIRLLGGTSPEITKFTLEGTDSSRSIVLIKKKTSTSGKYPRKAGVPTESPLC